MSKELFDEQSSAVSTIEDQTTSVNIPHDIGMPREAQPHPFV